MRAFLTSVTEEMWLVTDEEWEEIVSANEGGVEEGRDGKLYLEDSETREGGWQI
jgi:hypothetical protein